jgi:tetratricopeptide (TPR) repeat protein
MSEPQLARAFELGREHLVAGRIDAAAALYEELVRRAPSSAEAHYGRGLVALRQGESSRAVDALTIAVRLAPKIAAGHAKLGEALIGLDRHTHAVAALRKAIALSGRDAEAHLHLGLALAALGDERDAQVCFKTARNLSPNLAHEQLALGRASRESGRAVQAVRHLHAASALAPDSAEVHRELASALRVAGRIEEARTHIEHALRTESSDVDAWLEAGAVRLELGDASSAEQALARAIELAPTAAEPHVRMAVLRYRSAEPARAEQECDRALALEPDHVAAHVNRAFARLVQGDLREGFREFEWRKRRAGFRGSGLALPEWDGSALAGRTILLHTEQGLGDAIQMSRYAPLVEARGGRVVLGAPRELAPLLRSVRGVRDAWSSIRTEDVARIDVQCSLMSLPHLFDTALDSIPRETPYIAADPARVDRWRRELGAERRFKVGVVWAGSASNANDRSRSIALEHFAQIAALENVALFSLQKGAAAEHARPPGMTLVDLAPKLADFSDTAAALMHLDLLISVDTAACHLAGALGRPVWTLLPHAPDWRWLMQRSDTPWYPTMRLFRQKTPHDWSGVFDELRADLSRVAAQGQLS